MKKSITTLYMLILLGVTSCSQNHSKTDTENESVADTEAPAADAKSNPIYGIEGENIYLRQEPGEQSEKIVNEKATEALGETQYCQVDYTTKVEVLETQSDYSKIRVVEPDWLSETHIGWIPSKKLLNKDEEEKQELGKLERTDYQILKVAHNSSVENFHVLLKREDFDKNYVHQFIKQFRKEHCERQCNVSVYDSKVITQFIGVYPLPDEDYLKVADHLISISTFDATEVRDWYPYQDFRYKKLGGKNWKKAPVK